jgi:DNA-binding NarL/FixJ family response regulator
MTMHEDPYLVGEAFRAGPSAFLLKEDAPSELTNALDQVLNAVPELAGHARVEDVASGKFGEGFLSS